MRVIIGLGVLSLSVGWILYNFSRDWNEMYRVYYRWLGTIMVVVGWLMCLFVYARWSNVI